MTGTDCTHRIHHVPPLMSHVQGEGDGCCMTSLCLAGAARVAVPCVPLSGRGETCFGI